MILRHPVTGHEARTDNASADFWTAAGYRPVESEDKPKRQTHKAAAKKAAATKSSNDK